MKSRELSQKLKAMAKRSKRLSVKEFIDFLSRYEKDYEIDVQGLSFQYDDRNEIGLPDPFANIGLPNKLVIHRITLLKQDKKKKNDEKINNK